MSTHITTTAQALPVPAPSAAAVAGATQLLAYLSPLFPNVASLSKTEAGAAWWIASWATQIEIEGIGPRRLAGALTLLGRLDPNLPLSWPRFADLVRQHTFSCPDLIEDGAHRERRMREFQAKYPGARFPAAEPHDE